MLARTYPDAVSEQDAEDTQRLIGAVARNWPDILVEMQASPRQIRNFFKKRGERKPLDVATSQLPLLSVNGPIVRSCMEKFSRKLITALHYKHTGRIIPLEGGIAWQWYSSVQALNGELPHGFIKLLGGEPKIHRTGKSLNDQFDYVYGVTDDASVAGYFATFRSSFAVLGYVVPDVTQLPGVVPSREVLRPLTAPMSA